MKAQTRSELDCKKKELGKLHKLGISKSTGASGNSRSISMVPASDTTEERDYSGAPVNIARAVDVFLLRKGTGTSINKRQSLHVSTPFKVRLKCKQVGAENEQ